jgi:phage baseplate assembly protein W
MDIYHYYGGDVGLSAKGDLQAVDNILEGQQRILRRLLTNPGDYIFHPNYGAGLPRYVGRAMSPAVLLEIKGLVNAQIKNEQRVAQNPAPLINIKGNIDGSFYINIQYTDAPTKSSQALAFTVSE